MYICVFHLSFMMRARSCAHMRRMACRYARYIAASRSLMRVWQRALPAKGVPVNGICGLIFHSKNVQPGIYRTAAQLYMPRPSAYTRAQPNARRTWVHAICTCVCGEILNAAPLAFVYIMRRCVRSALPAHAEFARIFTRRAHYAPHCAVPLLAHRSAHQAQHPAPYCAAA